VPDARIATTSEYGVLGVRTRFESRSADDGPGRFTLDRYPPAEDLAGLVERYWVVSWEVPPGSEASITLLPHPCANVVLDRRLLTVSGVGRGRFTYTYRGVGGVFGIKFRPGGFLPFLGRPMSDITDTAFPAEHLWGAPADALAERMTTAPGLDNRVALVEEFLRERWPPPDPQVEFVQRIVAALLHDRTIARVDDVTEMFGVNSRTLQRLFQRYVGVSPKWVLRRYRLHEAAAVLAREQYRPWAEVAGELGYFDQSHFIRDFTAAIGMTPGAYAQACRRMEAPISA
jgi:AraC-like DNA-binding protein